MIHLCLEVDLHSAILGSRRQQSSTGNAEKGLAFNTSICMLGNWVSYLGRFERVVRWKMDFDHEDSLCIGAVWRPAVCAKLYSKYSRQTSVRPLRHFCLCNTSAV